MSQAVWVRGRPHRLPRCPGAVDVQGVAWGARPVVGTLIGLLSRPSGQHSEVSGEMVVTVPTDPLKTPASSWRTFITVFAGA